MRSRCAACAQDMATGIGQVPAVVARRGTTTTFQMEIGPMNKRYTEEQIIGFLREVRLEGQVRWHERLGRTAPEGARG